MDTFYIRNSKLVSKLTLTITVNNILQWNFTSYTGLNENHGIYQVFFTIHWNFAYWTLTAYVDHLWKV